MVLTLIFDSELAINFGILTSLKENTGVSEEKT